MVQYIYTLGAAGERLSVAELGRNVEYTYDNLYRLTGETITEGENVTAYTYSYDNVGNRILKTKNGLETEYTYNELNQLVSDSDATYEYDLNGNLVRVIGGAQAALYEYNSENKLVKATAQQGVNVVEETYTYDYAGNRISKTTSTSDGNFEVVKYLNDNSSLTNVLAEINSEGEVSVYYTIGADLISQERNGRTYTYLYDGHGSVVGLMNEGGSVTDTYTYDAFGNLLKSTGRTANNYRYCGEQFDSTTGLYYLRARYMDTNTGRFISQDSYAGNVYDPVSLHKYLYCNADPVNNVDPSGYCSNVIAPNCATVMLAEMQAAVATAAMAVWNWFLSLLPTIMVAATGFSAILLDNPAFIDISEQFLSGNLSIYDLQQQIIETFQKIDQSVRDYIYEARNGGSSNNSSGGSSNNGGMSQGDPNKWKDFLDKFKPEKINHIIEGSKDKDHHWERVVPDKNWEEIKNLIIRTMEEGVDTPYKGVMSRILTINGYDVQVTYAIIDGVERISDAWVIS